MCVGDIDFPLISSFSNCSDSMLYICCLYILMTYVVYNIFDICDFYQYHWIDKEEFEDTKGAIKTVYRRRTDNTMAKRKSTKLQTTITKHTHKTKDRATRTPLKTESESRCSGRASSCCSTSDTHYANLDTNPVISDG